MSTNAEALYPVSRRSQARAQARARAGTLPGPIKLGLVVVLGLAMGLGSTMLVLDRGWDPAAVRIGPWTSWPKSGTVDIDPYAHAIFASTGEIALVSAEGIVFKATSDDAGADLSTHCRYRVAGPVPASRFWTLTASTPSGSPMGNPAGRYGFSSTEVLHREDGSFEVEASASARPGNWLPLSGEGRFSLVLRLYEAPLALVSADLGKVALPSVARLGCAS